MSGEDASLEYHVVEVATVTDEEIERVLNQTTGEGWRFESMHFAMRESSKRPAMAFVLFTKQVEDPPEDG